MVGKEKWEELLAWMKRLAIQEEDLLEKFILGSGSGGQKINKTSSCVFLQHLPTGITIKCQKSRVRDLNRLLARRELCRKLENQKTEKISEEKRLQQKIRKQKKRRSKKTKEKLLADKRHLSEKKSLRKAPEIL